MAHPSTGFGEELRRRRLAAGLSLTALSGEVHYSKAQLSMLAHGLDEGAERPQAVGGIGLPVQLVGIRVVFVLARAVPHSRPPPGAYVLCCVNALDSTQSGARRPAQSTDCAHTLTESTTPRPRAPPPHRRTVGVSPLTLHE